MKKEINKKKLIIIILSVVIVASSIITATIQIAKQIQIRNLEGKPLIEYEVKGKISEKVYSVLIKINSIEGIETVTYTDSKTNKLGTINTYGKMTVGIDIAAVDKTNYEFKIKIKDKEEVTEIIYFEAPRIHGNYTLDDGIYVYEPDLTGYNKDYTRYLDIDENNNLTPGNWISGESPENWYNYSESQWANILIENNGLEAYYLWIPRYCFKLNQETQRADVKFINVYNEYIDAEGNVTQWEELKEQGYQIPEAFEHNYTMIPGYWAMKYTAGVRNVYTVNFETIATKTKIKIKSISTNTTTEIKKYTYAINGQILKESTIAEDFEYEMNTDTNNIVNVTILDENNVIIGSMTKECKQTKVNSPDLTELVQETTFYVTYDENGNEHSTIPISQTEPENWYDYGESKWANIVIRNNGLEAYYTWIPRYEFKLDQTSQRSNINFIEGTSTETTHGYQIPEAFTFNGEEIPGYWAMKYTAGGAMALKFDTEVAATNSSIRTKGIIGTAQAEGQVYRYYINGEYKGQSTDATAPFEYTGLNSNTEYTILVEIRDSSTDEYLGTVVKQISTVDANKPEFGALNEKNNAEWLGLNPEMTYYVLYDNDGNETIGDKIKLDGSNMPTNWYNYSESRWANIVITDGTVVNGQITGATATAYYVWIPRYEFMITSSQYAQPATGRTEVRFIQGTSTDTDEGYQIPEAFTFNGQELPGYWAMKYTAGE